MAERRFHTIVVGGGCLGCASAISVQRQLRFSPQPKADAASKDVCIIDKSFIGSGLTARHSGIIRAANANLMAAVLARKAIERWKNLIAHWGVAAPYESCGAIWVAKEAGHGANERWSVLEERMATVGVRFDRIDSSRVDELCPEIVSLHEGEIYFFEPNAIQVDPAAIRKLLYAALDIAGVDVHEKTTVTGFETGNDGHIEAVLTDQGRFGCDYVVNAAGPWSPTIFASLGISIPIGAEPVTVTNWLASARDLTKPMPVIADYVNLAYFRVWPGSQIHMHQPRTRSLRDTARVFAANPLQTGGADFVSDPSNQGLSYAQVRHFEELVGNRFKSVDATAFGSGFRSFFDITPDLQFILGSDVTVRNLIHCLGAGQSFKYAPVFGEIVAEAIFGAEDYTDALREFSIGRFGGSYMLQFFRGVAGTEINPNATSGSL